MRRFPMWPPGNDKFGDTFWGGDAVPVPKRSQAQRSISTPDPRERQLAQKRDREARDALSRFKEKGGSTEFLSRLVREAIDFKSEPRWDNSNANRQHEQACSDLDAVRKAIGAMDRLHPGGKRGPEYYIGRTFLECVCEEQHRIRSREASGNNLLIKNWLYYLALCDIQDYVRQFTHQPIRVLAPLFSKLECRRVSPKQLEVEYLRAQKYVAQLPSNVVSAFRSVFGDGLGIEVSTLMRRARRP